ncbi:DUF4389 domain-containing protein [Candidatus Bipolaricaulota bacterium]|nr:DUF4389 domain-containing protein [Candidatus Bipolaricaulota bacterium]
MKAGKAVAVVLGTILALIAVGALIGGSVLLWANQTQRDQDGFFNTRTFWLSGTGSAIVTSPAELAMHPGDWWPADPPATVKLRVRSASANDIFVAIGPADAVSAYLQGVAYDELEDLPDRFRDYERSLPLTSRSGVAPGSPPAEQTFWATSVSGGGEQILTWEVRPGSWSAVIMNADATAPVSVSAIAGVRIPILGPISIGLLAGGVFLAGLASLLLRAATRRLGQPATGRTLPSEHGGPYPVILSGTLDPDLSPALWLIKWFLAIPHLVVLSFLWAAYAIFSFFAWISILFTGRYPRGIFEFNLGVMRWSWRVSYYAFSAIGTDRYPPFSLQDVDYPARLSIAYPEHLSPGLALVKWWLLAIPHYIIVGAFTSGIVFCAQDTNAWGGDNPALQTGGGLIAILVLIAGVALLFSGRYPRGIFNLVMGLNRWTFRLWGYAGLMTDAYPPFRLDMGGEEASTPQAEPPNSDSSDADEAVPSSR